MVEVLAARNDSNDHASIVEWALRLPVPFGRIKWSDTKKESKASFSAVFAASKYNFG